MDRIGFKFRGTAERHANSDLGGRHDSVNPLPYDDGRM